MTITKFIFIQKVALILIIATFFGCKARLQQVEKKAYTIDLSSSMPQDSAFLQFILPFKEQMNADMQQVIGFSDVEMPRDRASKAPETLLGNFVADLVLAFAKKSNPDQEVQISLLNIGGLRNSLAKGEITKKNVFELMPFDNELVILELNGTQMQQMFEYIRTKPQPFAGMQLFFDGKNCMATIAQQSFDENKKYKIVTSDFLADGGDLMHFLNTEKRQRLSVKLRDVILQHIIDTKNISASSDQRIRYSHE